MRRPPLPAGSPRRCKVHRPRCPGVAQVVHAGEDRTRRASTGTRAPGRCAIVIAGCLNGERHPRRGLQHPSRRPHAIATARERTPMARSPPRERGSQRKLAASARRADCRAGRWRRDRPAPHCDTVLVPVRTPLCPIFAPSLVPTHRFQWRQEENVDHKGRRFPEGRKILRERSMIGVDHRLFGKE